MTHNTEKERREKNKEDEKQLE